MPIDRRDFVAGAILSLIASPSHAQSGPDWASLSMEDTATPVIPNSLQSFASSPSLDGPISGIAPFGTQTPTDEEKKLAAKVLSNVPTGRTPVEIALYFLDVGSGKFGQELRPYITAWPERWNPVIVEFFSATHTQPSGDTTSWCAAFVNYCLLKSAEGRTLPNGSADPTYSAAARTFRNWGTATTAPRPGDIAVFRLKSSSAHGHVGFFISETADRVLVLGGNQFEGSPVRHTINRKYVGKNAVLQLDSYRTDPQLHA